MANLWYISPSDQSRNIGIGNYGSEESQMIKLADAIVPHLDRCGVQFHLADPDVPIDDRPAQSNSMNADYYLALHSNAGGGGNAWGPIAFYHTSGKPLAEQLIRELLATGQKTNRSSNVIQNTGLFELRAPIASAVLLEVDFHDSQTGVDFLINRRADAAKAIAKAIVAIDGKQWVETTANAKEQAISLGLFPANTKWSAAMTNEEAAKALMRLKEIMERG